MGAADTFFKAAVELLLYVEQGSLELQLHKIQPTDVYIQAHDPSKRLILQHKQGPGHGVEEHNTFCDYDSDDSEGEIAAIRHLAVWPPLVDPYLSALVSSFHCKHGSNLYSLRVCTAVLRVLQLINTLHLDLPLLLPSSPHLSASNKKYQASGSNGGFTKLFSASELKVLSSSLDLEESLPDAATQNSITTAREDFLRTSFRRITLLGKHSANEMAISKASMSLGDATSAFISTSMNASTDVSTSASSVCYVLSDLWSMKVQWVRSIHLEALLNADYEDLEHRNADRDQDGELAEYASDCTGARDIEVENLLPLVCFPIASFPSPLMHASAVNESLQ